MSVQNSIARLEYLCDSISILLEAIPEKDFSFSPSAQNWSKKEILGHLIDSASTNHHRFVRAQFEESPSISYDQNKWNAANFYREMDHKHIISLWRIYNKHLVELLKRMPKENFEKLVYSDGEIPHRLDFILDDYLKHLEHHLHQLVEYT